MGLLCDHVRLLGLCGLWCIHLPEICEESIRALLRKIYAALQACDGLTSSDSLQHTLGRGQTKEGVTEHLASVPGRVTLSNVSERKDNMRLGLSLATNPKDNSFLVRTPTPLLSPALLPAQPHCTGCEAWPHIPTHMLLCTPCMTAPSTLLMVHPYGPTGTGPDGCGSSCWLGPLLQWIIQKGLSLFVFVPGE